MNTRILFTLAASLAVMTLPAISGEADATKAAARKLSESENYSWTTTVKVPEGTRFRSGPSHGKLADGMVEIRSAFRDSESVSYLRGGKGALTDRDGNWQSLSELENSEGFGRFRAMRLRNFQSPADQAAEIAAGVTEWGEKDGALSGELSKEAAKQLMQFRRGRRGGQDGPEIFGAIGSAKFWIKDGVLQKFEYHVEGLMEFNGNDRDIDRTTTVEIKDVGGTKIEIPDAAKAKLS